MDRGSVRRRRSHHSLRWVGVGLGGIALAKTNPGSVQAIVKNASGGTAPIPIATNQGGPWGIVVDSQFVFWTNFNDDNVKKAPIPGSDGGAPQTVLLAQNQNNTTAIAIDEFNIYWASQGNQQIMKVAK